MTNTVITCGGTNSPTTTQYTTFSGSGLAWSTTRTAKVLVMPSAGTISKLYINSTTDPTPGNYAFTVFKGNTGQSLTCTLPAGATSINDLVNSFSVAQGDTIALQAIPASSPTALVTFQASCIFTSTVTGESCILGVGAAQPSTTATRYVGVQGNNSPTSVEANASQVMPTNGTISELWINLDTSPIGAANYVFTLYKNTSAQTQTVTITGAATSGNDIAHPISITAGDTVSLEIIPNGSPAAVFLSWGFKWVPTIDGESVQLFSGSGAGTANATTYCPISGVNSWNATEANRYQLLQACTIKKLFANYGTAPGVGLNRVLTAMNGGSPTTLTATLSGTNTTVNDTVNSAVITAGTTASIRDAANIGVASSTSKIGYVTFISPSTGPRHLPFLGAG